MARIESDKEDLMAEASALAERAEFQMSATDSEIEASADDSPTVIVTVGFRRNDHFSLYFDQDPFYQFDTNGMLRRAYEGGFLYRSQGTTLTQLHRQRTEESTVLRRVDLPQQELEDFRQRMRTMLSHFLKHMQTGQLNRLRFESPRGDIETRTATALTLVLNRDDHFLSTAIRKRR